MARTAEDLLQELMALDESQRIEAKRCLDGAKTLILMAYEGRGITTASTSESEG